MGIIIFGGGLSMLSSWNPDLAGDFLLDLLEDEDQEDAGIHTVNKKKYYILWKKKDIVQMPYAAPCQVWLTA
jgi:hypothetical protein